MEYIDTHAHIFAPEFDGDRDAVMAAAVAVGVRRMLLPAIDPASNDALMQTCRQYPRNCFPMMGLHPTSVNDNPRWRDDLEQCVRLVKESPRGLFCGVGEIGLDYYWSRDFRDEQREVFVRQLELSLEEDLPVAIHVREAWDDVMDIVLSMRGRGLKGVFHSFSGTVDMARELCGAGDFLFGIGGPATYKKSLQRVVREMDLSLMVLETDCPYQSPQPHCGTRNEPSYIPLVCNAVAQIKGVTPDLAAQITTENAVRMFLADKNGALKRPNK